MELMTATEMNAKWFYEHYDEYTENLQAWWDGDQSDRRRGSGTKTLRSDQGDARELVRCGVNCNHCESIFK